MALITKQWHSACAGDVKVNIVYDDVTLNISRIDIINDCPTDAQFEIVDKVLSVTHSVTGTAGQTTTFTPPDTIKLVEDVVSNTITTGSNFSTKLTV